MERATLIEVDLSGRAAVAEERKEERPFEGGAQPVTEHPPEVPSGGRAVAQAIVIAVVVLVVLAGILWLVVPFGG